MNDKILIKRTLGIEVPDDLAFGEPVLVEGRDTVVVGKSDGSYLEIGSSVLPPLATVALTNDYNDLDNLPVIPELPPLATVALTNDYNDLDNLPVIPELPPLADVAYSGSYDDLADKPIGGDSSPDLIPPAGTEITTSKLYHNGTGYKVVYRQRLIVATPYPANNYIVRTHGISNIETVVDYALFYRGAGYLYKVTYGEIPSGITETALFGLTDYIWGSAKNKNTDGSAAQGAWFEVEYTKSTDSYVTV